MTVPLPPGVREGVEAALVDLGLPGHIAGVTSVSGGCINHGARLDTPDGGSFFLKWNGSAPPGMFPAEAAGLRALRAGGPLRLPEPLAHGGGRGAAAPAWLLMEHVPAGRPAADHDTRLGRGLAALHAGAAPTEGFGWPGDNWIGSLPQANGREASWSAFWRERRIAPQLRRAVAAGALSGRDHALLDRLLDRIPEALRDVDEGPPQLLHGDLWGGNAYADEQGAPVLIDPAVYRGHGEVDLAMSELFGGFGRQVYTAYDEILPISGAYRAYRRDLYQLYYLLVHVNLFGGGYVRGSVAAAQRVLSALSG